MGRAAALAALCVALQGCLGVGEAGQPERPQDIQDPPPVPRDTPARVFTHFPFDIRAVDYITGLGHVIPRHDHVLPAHHMHCFLRMGDTNRYTVLAPAGGRLFTILNDPIEGTDDYSIYVKVSESIVYNLGHVRSLAPWIEDRLRTLGGGWQPLLPPARHPSVYFMDTPGRPAGIKLTAGAPLATFEALRDSTGAARLQGLAFFVIDRGINHWFANPSSLRYPSYQELVATLGFRVDYPFLGNPYRCAGQFPLYYRGKIRSTLDGLLRNGLGRNAWDVADRLRGSWFNPEIDALARPVLHHESAAVSIIPSRDDHGRYAVAIGNNHGALPVPAALDPGGREEMGHAFTGPMAASGDVNPDPETVGVGRTVAYDLEYSLSVGGRVHHTLLCHMTSGTEVRFKVIFHPADPMAASAAAADLAANPAPDGTWVRYIR